MLKTSADDLGMGGRKCAARRILRLRCGCFPRRYTLWIMMHVLSSVHVHSLPATDQPFFTWTVIHVHIRVPEFMNQKHVTSLSLVTAGMTTSCRRPENEATHALFQGHTAFCRTAIGRGSARLSQGINCLQNEAICYLQIIRKSSPLSLSLSLSLTVIWLKYCNIAHTA